MTFLGYFHEYFRTEDWKHEMKWKHKLVQIAFRNYNSFVYYDLFLKPRLFDRLTKVWEHHDKALR